MKLYIITNNEEKILLFNEKNDTIITTDFGIDLIKELEFREFQLSLIVEFEVKNERNTDYSYINPYTGKLLMTNNTSTHSIGKSQMRWEERNKKWILINWSNSDSILDNIKFKPITFDLRIIWSNNALLTICKQPNIYRELNSKKYFIDSAIFLHDSIKTFNRESQLIIDDEIKKIQEAEKKINLKTDNILITCGSQAAGKSSYFNYINGQDDETFINYENINYYNVDSDRYISYFSINTFLNNIPIMYTNNLFTCINSYKEIIPNIFQSEKYTGKDPHKHIEWTLEQWCLTNQFNFVKQGTSLWLKHIMENTNYKKFNKLILFFWISKVQMSDRLNRRLTNLRNIRYFYDTVIAINSYDSDWSNSAKAIMIEHFRNIFNDDKKYSFCIIFSDENKDKGIRESTCFTIKDNKFIVNKQGIINIVFFMKLLLYLTEHNLSELSKKELIDGTINLEISHNLLKQSEQLQKMLELIPSSATDLHSIQKEVNELADLQPMKAVIPPEVEESIHLTKDTLPPIEKEVNESLNLPSTDIVVPEINEVKETVFPPIQKLGGKMKTRKRKTYKRKTRKRKTHKRKTHKRK